MSFHWLVKSFIVDPTFKSRSFCTADRNKVPSQNKRPVYFAMERKVRLQPSSQSEDGENDVEKGSLDDGDGVAIIMNYGQNGSRTVRSFATELPPELEDKGITQKDFGKVVQHVNGIWDSFGEKFEGISEANCLAIRLIYHNLYKQMVVVDV